MNLTKIRRGICVHHFSAVGSCPWRNGCMYTHDIPPEALADKKIIQDQKRKMQEITRKVEASKSQKPTTSADENGGRKKDTVVKMDEKLLTKQGTGDKTKSLKNVEERASHSGTILSKNKKSKNAGSKTVSEKEDASNSAPNISKHGGDYRKSRDSFLELIRPMIMDQMKEIVHQYVEPYVQKTFQNVMANQLTMI